MKTKTNLCLLALAALLPLWNYQLSADPLGTAFTYQGKLGDGGNAASGIYDLRFAICDSASGGNTVGGPLTNAAVVVSNGYFTVTLDFGAVFDGNARWLEIGVRTNGSASDFTTLAPRQPLTPAPYALYAPSAGAAATAATAATANAVAAPNITGTLGLAQLPAAVLTNNQAGVTLTGAFSGNGAGVTNVNLMTLDDQGAIGWTTNWGNFSLVSSPGVGSGPQTVISADVNGDGKLDLICANYYANTLSVLTNNGSGGFVLASSPGVGVYPTSVTAADVNGDGKLDLICANYGAATLSVLTNNGSGGFVLASSPAVGSSPRSVTAVDVNGDGKVDLICANTSSATVSVLTNNGSGGFALASSPAVAGEPMSVTAADVNGDGKVDLIIACFDASVVTVLTNDGSGGFVFASWPGAGSGPVSVTTADVNADGKVDLITANVNNNTLSVLTNNGSGGFVLASTLAVGNGPVWVTAADVNGDGKVDLVSANRDADTLSVLTNNGSGGFVLAATLAVGSAPHSVTVGDVNGDGKVDLISANATANTLSVFFNGPSYNGLFQGSFTGDGSGITALNASQLGSGTVALARLPGAVVTNNATSVTLTGSFTGNGSGLTNLNVANLTGRIADAQLSANVALLNTNQVFSGSNRFAGVVTLTNTANTYAGTFAGNGSGLTNLNAAQLASGTVPLAQLPSAVVTNNAANITLAGAFNGNGSGLTNINATQLASGTLADARLSTNVALLNTNQVFSGSNRFAGVVTLTNAANTLAGAFAGTFAGNGSGVTNLNASQLTSGTVPWTQLPGALVTNNETGVTLTGAFTGNGGGLTNLNASQLTSGTLPLAQLPAAAVTNNETGVALAGVFTGNGGGLTNLSAANLTGTIADAQLSPNVALRNTTNTFTATNWFSKPIGIGMAATNLPGQLLQVGDPNILAGSVGMIRLASRYASNYRIWDIGVPQNIFQPTPYDYSFVIDDTLLGTGPEFMIHWGTGYVGIAKTNPATALDVNGTVTATGFAGNAAGLTNQVCSANYVFSYSTTTQAVVTAGFQDITNNTDAQISGWTHAANTASFTCGQSGLYLVHYDAEATSTTTASSTVSLRAVVNGTEIPGSESTANVNTANLVVPISKSFICSFSSGGVLKFQLAGEGTADRLVSNTGTGTTQPSFSCTIMRLQ